MGNAMRLLDIREKNLFQICMINRIVISISFVSLVTLSSAMDFSNRALWESMLTGETTETFNSVTMDTDFTNGFTVNDVTLDVLGSFDDSFTKLDATPYTFNFGTRDGTVVYLNFPSNGPDTTVEFAQAVSAFGFDYNFGFPMEVEYNGTSTLLSTSGDQFFGFIGGNGVSITSFTLSIPTGASVDGGGYFDNVSSVVVPEPASVGIFMGAIGFLMATCFRRRCGKKDAERHQTQNIKIKFY